VVSGRSSGAPDAVRTHRTLGSESGWRQDGWRQVVKSGHNVDPTLRPDSRLAFRRQVCQTHGMQGIIVADVLNLESGCFP